MRGRDPVARRRLAALSVIAVLALVAGLLVGQRPSLPSRMASAPARSSDRPATRPVGAAALPLERRVGEVLIMSFDGASAPPYILRRLRSGEGGGVILFGANAPTAAVTRRLTDAMQRAAGNRALIATDQEGGAVRSLAFSAPVPSQNRLTGPSAARTAAADAAAGLRRHGVNVNLAPVADVAAPAGSSVVSGRAYPGDSRAVAADAAAAVGAYGAARVGATAKHFPGLGRALANTDEKSVTVDATRDELLARDTGPFRAAVGARVPLVMMSHALYPALDRAAIASQSRPIVKGLLRGRLGFRGVVVTDSIEAQAVLDRGGIAEAAERSIDAGVDLILMTGSGSFNVIQPRVLARARRDAAFRRRVTEAADRVLALKRELGLAAPPR